MLTTFPAVADINIAYRLVEDWCSRFFPLVAYKQVEWGKAEVDEVHQEVLERDKRFGEAISVRAFVEPGEQNFPQGRFGLESVRKPLLHISVPDLVSAGLATQDEDTKVVTLAAQPGDRFWFSPDNFGGPDIEYEVLSVRRGRAFGNTDLALYYEFPSERRRLESSDYAGL
jgi:hypothetical protein